jgi:ferredoxin
MFKLIDSNLFSKYLGSDSVFERSSSGNITISRSGHLCPAACIKCHDRPCLKFQDVRFPSKFELPLENDDSVCPTHALKVNSDGTLCLKSNLCIGCGLCVSRCPMHCLRLHKGKLILPSFYTVDEVVPDPSFVLVAKKTGAFDKSGLSDGLVSLEKELGSKGLDFNFPNLLTRNLFLALGKTFGIRRRGDNILRIDGFSLNGDQEICLSEIEFQNAEIECPRAALDDYCIFKEKFNKTNSKIDLLIVLPFLPNSRSEFWRVLGDIKKITDLQVDVVTIGALCWILWSGGKLDNSKTIFLDYSTLSIRRSASTISGFSIPLPEGFASAFEPVK